MEHLCNRGFAHQPTRPTPTPARLPVTGAGIPAAGITDDAKKSLKISKLRDTNIKPHKTWASENHSLHLLQLIGRNVCDRGTMRTCK
jgi:hypothetical protein